MTDRDRNKNYTYVVVRYYHRCAEYMEKELIRAFITYFDALEFCDKMNKFNNCHEYEVEKKLEL